MILKNEEFAVKLILYTSHLFLFFMTWKTPGLTADGIVFKENSILLIQRKNNPFQGFWALPGGYVEYGETTESAVVREMLEETGLQTKIRSLVGVYSDPKRDPRGHTITVAYLLEAVGGDLLAGDDAGNVKFFKLEQLPDLAFDHSQIIMDALQRR
jgi:8-oxo-dGTP diphosphatase